MISDIVGSDISVSDVSAPRLGADLFFLMMSSKLMSIFSVILELELKLIDEMALDFLWRNQKFVLLKFFVYFEGGKETDRIMSQGGNLNY